MRWGELFLLFLFDLLRIGVMIMVIFSIFTPLDPSCSRSSYRFLVFIRFFFSSKWNQKQEKHDHILDTVVIFIVLFLGMEKLVLVIYEKLQASSMENEDIFPEEVPNGLPPIRGIEHQIDFIPNRPAYRCNPEETKEIQKQVSELMEKGAINKIMVKYRHPIPRLDDMLDELHGDGGYDSRTNPFQEKGNDIN
ncbi:Retrotransposon protein [Musa troglodytarum]|uniref:Retrotransposon protein n=1 Tax=Musa troglodytarum TaxID=320322 RepID=A0A9E7LAN3_9LILI|nr:Retrotransposon protein [Musa troglodytarum]